jgi:hypothetical protein
MAARCWLDVHAASPGTGVLDEPMPMLQQRLEHAGLLLLLLLWRALSPS